MHPNPRSFRRVACSILTITIVLLEGLSGFAQPQAQQTGQSFPTQDNPRIVISNASVVMIEAWDKREVSITHEVFSGPLQPEEVRIKSEDNKLEVSCHPAKPDRKIFLTVRAPAKAVLEIKAYGNTVQVREPQEQITINNASKELIQLSVPESTALDMREAHRASARRHLPQGGNVQIGMVGQVMGGGPPYVKVTAATAQVATVIGSIQTVTRPPTLAATTIARRNSSMGKALRRSAPQLVRPSARLDQTAPLKPAEAEEGTLKLETYLVNLNVSATDRAGKAVPGLKQDDFSVYEEGVPQRISFFSPERAPFNLVLLLDLSGSVRDKFDLIRATAIHFLDVISPQDSVAVVTFTTDVTVVSPLTKDRDDLRDSIDNMLAPSGGTSFYDALGYVLVEVLRKVKGQRNAVIAITDGEDNALQAQLMVPLRPVGMTPAMGSFLAFDELLEGAKEADALIVPIHIDPAPPQLSASSNRNPPTRMTSPVLQIQSALTDIAKEQLQSLAKASGGRFYHANRIEDLKGVFEQVAAELRTIYSMAYSPKDLNLDGRFRRIRVQLNRPDVGIRTRPGYYGR